MVVAPFAGSFLGVLVARLPSGRSVGWSRSACDTCHRTLSARDMVPLFSYLALRGRCRSCVAPIGRFHLWIELAATLVALWAAASEADADQVWIACALGWTLLALSWIDIEHFLLPDLLTLPLLLAGLVATFWRDPADVTAAAIGAACGYLLLRGAEIAYRTLRHRDGLGQGDAKLMAAAGAWVGWEALGHVILGAALIGIAWILALRKIQGTRVLTQMIPFGPCISASLWVYYLYFK